RLGVDVILHLLTETALYVKLPNECLCQITGEPLINLPVPSELVNSAVSSHNLGEISCHRHALKRKEQMDHPDEPAQKRLRHA
ncbi:hypothetical protein BC835DRAFT_1211101, partial [Cytidiella melzeri]